MDPSLRCNDAMKNLSQYWIMKVKLSILILLLLQSIPMWGQKINWFATRKLTYSDFKNKIEPDKSSFRHENAAHLKRAASSTIGWNYEITSSTTNDNIDLKIYAFFDPTKSWMKNEYKNEYVLNHEQKHFDIAEIYKRKLQQRIKKEIKGKKDFERKFDQLYHQVYTEYCDFQKKYDSETLHGTIVEKQKEFDVLITDMLSQQSQKN